MSRSVASLFYGPLFWNSANHGFFVYSVFTTQTKKLDKKSAVMSLGFRSSYAW